MRLILIDNHSGYIFGDLNADSMIEAAEKLDVSIGEHGRHYEETFRLASNETGYRVYRADINGSEAIPAIEDGQDQETIEAVEMSCEWIGCIRCVGKE